MNLKKINESSGDYEIRLFPHSILMGIKISLLVYLFLKFYLNVQTKPEPYMCFIK